MDGGLKWEQVDTPADWLETNSPPCIYHLKSPNDKNRLMVFSVMRSDSFNTGPMSLTYSENDGETWEPVRSLGLPCHLPFTSVIELEGGRHLGLYQCHRNSNSRNHGTAVWQAISRNGGLTWGDEKPVCWRGESVGEPEVVPSRDGQQLLCLMRARREHSLWMVSDNEGECWSEPEETPWGLTGHRHKAHYTNDKKRLVVVFRDKAPQSCWEGHFVAWVGSYGNIARGEPGEYRVKLVHTHVDEKAKHYDRDCGYGGLELLPNGTFVAITYAKYRRGSEGNSIVSVRFNLDELDEKVKRQGR